jgi:hypothetical protein
MAKKTKRDDRSTKHVSRVEQERIDMERAMRRSNAREKNIQRLARQLQRELMKSDRALESLVVQIGEQTYRPDAAEHVGIPADREPRPGEPGYVAS